MRVLIVDDQASQRAILRHLVQDIDASISVTDFADPVQALLWSQEQPPDMVILDYRMPKMDGLEFARRFRRPLSQRDVPVMLVTVVGDEPLRQAALDAGIIDFMVKPIRPRELRSRCKNLLDLRQRQQALKSRTHVLEHQVVSGTQEVERVELGVLARFYRLLGQRQGHPRPQGARIAAFSSTLALAMELGEAQSRRIREVAPLRDIGNFGVPEELLNRAGPLDERERTIMQRHTLLGHELLSGGSTLLQLGAEIALSHHERWDGSGYPAGLAGHQIPQAARIVAVADVLDALLSPRPWRPAWAIDDALAYVRANSGSLFDPAVVKMLGSREPEILAAQRDWQTEAAFAADAGAGSFG